MKKTALVLACLALISCRTAPSVSYSSFTSPEIGVTATEEIGEPLLTQATGMSRPAIVIPTDQKLGDFIVHQGKYTATSQTRDYVRFSRVNFHNATTQHPHNGNLHVYTRHNGTRTVCLSRTVCGDIDYSIDKATKFSANSFQQTLIYSGKIGNRITLGYRESSGDMARPAFNNDVTYDLSESKIVGYKGARLEVIDATNTAITYKVLANFK